MRLDKERLAARLEGHKEGIVQTDQIRYNGFPQHLYIICFQYEAITSPVSVACDFY